MSGPAPIDCPRCGSKSLNPITLVCSCSAEFTPQGYAFWRSLPVHLALRTIRA